ncbi:hypothetical protein HMPREF1022_00878 [Desulfovibrio sp. 6_1_46AFAA]|uniref:hypothetical protein n=1 Tax=Desulfovibrio sp. 6_1_46AFAA TaxID=665942 RepID=UPI00022370EB|nr:hypothetical protein [Desulfovibrio sp. 6_1_46AFAA]EGW52095.1 hypothetical protein HMPREF1022_00878 [Desulfovibrio sp. 6_1_46AFAA]
MKQLLACFLLLLLAVPALAEDNIPLFKDYYYGMPKAEVQKKSQAVDCKHENLIGDLCVKKLVTFGKQKWEQVFMIEDGKLTSVMLAKSLDAQSLMAAIQTVAANDYALLNMSTGSKQLDVIHIARQQGSKAIPTAVVNFENESQNAPELIYAFYEAAKSQPIAKDKSIASFADFAMKAPRDLRSVEVRRAGNLLGIQFLAPFAALQDMQKKASEAKESF